MMTSTEMTSTEIAAAIEDAYGVIFRPRDVQVERGGDVYIGSKYAGTIRNGSFVADSRNWGGAKFDRHDY